MRETEGQETLTASFDPRVPLDVLQERPDQDEGDWRAQTPEPLQDQMNDQNKFTQQAARRWEELGARSQTLYLNNVWCGACRKSTTIVRFEATIEQGDLILEGECIACGGSVARLIEGS